MQCLSHYAGVAMKLTVYILSNWTCAFCLKDMTTCHASELTLEHTDGTVGAGHRGATHNASAMYLVCRACNGSKGSVTRHHPSDTVDYTYFINGYRSENAAYKIRRIAAILNTPTTHAAIAAERIIAGLDPMPNPTLLLKVVNGKVSREDLAFAPKPPK